MSPPGLPERTAVLWTGGKDCARALQETLARGQEVGALVTFVPADGSDFLAHPRAVRRAQARALELELLDCEVRRPYRAGYEAAIRALRRRGFGTLVTGDLGPVGDCTSWVRERAAACRVRVATPLWGRDRSRHLRSVPRCGIRAVVSYVRHGALPASWLGRSLDTGGCRELLRLARAQRFDPCGEQGEYHTLVLDMPEFLRRMRCESGPPRPAPDGVALTPRGVRVGGRADRPARPSRSRSIQPD